MKQQIRFLVALTMLLAAGNVFAVDSAEILKQATERCAQFEQDVQDMHMSQVMKSVMTDDELTFEQTVYTKGKKIRVEMQLPISEMEGGKGPGALRTVMINNGTQAWIVSPFGERKELTEEEARRSEPARNCWGYFPENARVTGSETVDGRDCHIVELEEEGVHTRLWLDKRSFIPVKGEARDSSSAEQYRWTHSDFHVINGDWEYPYKTEMYDGDDPVANITVTALEVNQGVPDELFDPEKVEVESVDLEQLMKMLTPLEDESTETAE